MEFFSQLRIHISAFKGHDIDHILYFSKSHIPRMPCFSRWVVSTHLRFFFFFFFFFLVFKLFLISCNKKMQTWRNRTKDDFTSSGLRDVPWQSYSSANLVSMEFEKFLLPWRKKIYNVLQKNKKFTTKNYKKKLREFMEFYMN